MTLYKIDNYVDDPTAALAAGKNVPEAVSKLLELATTLTYMERAAMIVSFTEKQETLMAAHWNQAVYIKAAVQKVISSGDEKVAVPALVRFLERKRLSKDMFDTFVIANALDALKYFGPKAKEATPTIEKFRNHEDSMIKASASSALEATR
jgi:hypothetical protein